MSSVIIDNLPREIQDLIFHYVVLDSTTDELKLFRQSNRYFRDRSDIYLFHTLHVSASNASLERVKKISENDKLNVHVRELVFHRGTFFGHKMAKATRSSFEIRPKDYDDFETYLVRSSTTSAPVALMNVSRAYANFTEELESESRFNQEMTWRSTLRGPLSKFPKLEKLTTLASFSDIESKYLRKRCGLSHQSWTPNYFAPYEIFEPCGRNFKPRSLSLDSINGEDFAAVISNIRGGEEIVAARFADLRHLHLSFSETVSTLAIEGTWDVFIRSCSNLQTLSLDFESFYSLKMLKEPESFSQKVIKIFLQQRYPRLNTLKLCYPLMTEHDFISFLDRHQTTLNTLSLYHWPMPVTNNIHPTGSIIRAFYKIGNLPNLRLKNLTIKGEFSNRADGEGWTANPGSSDLSLKSACDCILKDLIDWIKRDRGAFFPLEFPFHITTVAMDCAKTGKELQDLDMRPWEMGCWDESFEWWEHKAPLHSLHPVH